MTIIPRRLLVVGLGNLPYPSTRHSVGHFVIDSLAQDLGASLRYDKTTLGYHGSARATFNSSSYEILLFKSELLMNVSGPSVAKILRKSVQSPRAMVLVHDSLGHKVNVVSSRLGGSANGHNGVKSVISALGTQEFHRLRIGIGKNDIDAAEFVLQRLSNQERQFWSPNGLGLDLVLQSLETIATNFAVT